MVHHMTEQLAALLLTSCYSICTQIHEPWNRSDMNVLSVLCKGDILQDDKTRGKDEDK